MEAEGRMPVLFDQNRCYPCAEMWEHGKKSKFTQFKGTLEIISSLVHPAVSLQERILEYENLHWE